MVKSTAQRAPKENVLLPVILSALQDEQRGAMHIFSLRRKARDLIHEKKLPFKGLLNDALKIECAKLVERGWLNCVKNRYTPTDALTTFIDGQSSEMGLPAGRIEWPQLRELAKMMPTHVKDVEEHFHQRMQTRQSFGHIREATPPQEDELQANHGVIVLASPGRRSVKSASRQISASPMRRKPRYSEPNLAINNPLKPSRKSNGVRKSLGEKAPRRKSSVNRRHTIAARATDIDLTPVLAFLNAAPAQSSERQFLPFAQVLSTRAKRAIRRNLLSEEQGEIERGNRLTKKQNRIELLRVKKLLEESNRKLQELQEQLEQVRYAPTEYAASAYGGSIGIGAIHEDVDMDDEPAPIFDAPVAEPPEATPFRTRIALSPSRLFGSARSILSGSGLPNKKDKKISELEAKIAALNNAIARHQEEEKEREEYDIFHDAEDGGDTTFAQSEAAPSVTSNNFRAGSEDDISISHHRHSSPFKVMSPVTIQRGQNELSPIRDVSEPSEVATIDQPLHEEVGADFPDHHSDQSSFHEPLPEPEEPQHLEELRDAKSQLEEKTKQLQHQTAHLETIVDERESLQQQIRELMELSNNFQAQSENREKEFQIRIETAEREIALARESINEIEDLREDLKDERANYEELKREHDHAMLTINLSEKEVEQMQQKMAALDQERLEQLQALSKKVAELEKRIQSSGSSSEELQDALEAKEQEVEALRKELEEAEETSKEEIDELTSDVQKLEYELIRARDLLNAAEALIDEKEDSLLELKTENMDMDKERDDLKARLETIEENFNGVIDNLRSEIEAKDEKLSVLQQQNGGFVHGSEEWKAKISQLEEEIDALVATKEDAEGKLDYLQDQLDDARKDLEIARVNEGEFRKTIASVKEDLATLVQERDSLKEGLEKANVALEELATQKAQLRSDLDTALLDLDTANDTISELRERGEELERDIESLESEKQNLIGENNAITQLNDTLQQQKDLLLEEKEGYILTIEENTATIAELREIIFASAKEATTLRNEVDNLTRRWNDAKEGIVARVRELEGVKSEKNEQIGAANVVIEELEGRIKKFKDEVEEMKNALSAQKERADLAEANGEDLKFELHQAENRIEELKGEKMDLDDELTAANHKVVDLEGDLEDTIKNAKEKVEALEEANKELIKGVEDLKSLVLNLEAKKDELEGQYNDLSSKYQDLLDENASLDEQMRDADEANDRLIETGREKDKQIEELRESLQNKLQEMSKLEEVKQGLYATIEQMKSQFEESNISFESHIESLNSGIKNRDEIIASLKQQIQQYTQRLEHALDTADQEYARLKQDAADVEEELNEEIESLRNKLQTATQRESELSALVALLRTDLNDTKATVQHLQKQVAELQAENESRKATIVKLQQDSAAQSAESAETIAKLRDNLTSVQEELEHTIQANKEHILALQKRHQADSHNAQAAYDKMIQQLRFDHTREIENILQQAAEERTKDREASEEEKLQIGQRWEAKMEEIRKAHDATLKKTIAAFEREASKRLESMLRGVGEELWGDAQKAAFMQPLASPGANTKRKRAINEDDEEELEMEDSFSQATTQVTSSTQKVTTQNVLATSSGNQLFSNSQYVTTLRKDAQQMNTPPSSHVDNTEGWGVLGLWNSVKRRTSRGTSVASAGGANSLKMPAPAGKENKRQKRRFDSGIGVEDEDEEVGEPIPA